MLINTPTPERVAKKVRFGFEDRRLPWIKPINGMRLIGRVETLTVNEETGVEESYVEIKYAIRNVYKSTKVFEITLKCDPQHVNETFFLFSFRLR